MGDFQHPENDKEHGVRMGYIGRHYHDGEPVYFDPNIGCYVCERERGEERQKKRAETERRLKDQMQNLQPSDTQKQSGLEETAFSPQPPSASSVSEWIVVDYKCPEHSEFLYWNKTTLLLMCRVPGCSRYPGNPRPPGDQKPMAGTTDQTRRALAEKRPGVIDRLTKFIKGTH